MEDIRNFRMVYHVSDIPLHVPCERSFLWTAKFPTSYITFYEIALPEGQKILDLCLSLCSEMLLSNCSLNKKTTWTSEFNFVSEGNLCVEAFFCHKGSLPYPLSPLTLRSSTPQVFFQLLASPAPDIASISSGDGGCSCDSIVSLTALGSAADLDLACPCRQPPDWLRALWCCETISVG